jgi:hypothetical protein
VLLSEERFFGLTRNDLLRLAFQVAESNNFLIVLIEKKWLGLNDTMDSFRAMLKYRCVILSLHQWQGQRVSTRNE